MIDYASEWAILRDKEVGFIHFLTKYAKIVEAPTRDNPGGVTEFKSWPHLKKAIRVFLTRLMVVWMKSRQIGASWLVAAYVLWFAMTQRGATIILFSKGELEAMELLGKCRRIFNHLPEWMRLKVNPDSATEMSFPAMESTIKALAATETAGIGFTASIIVCDEWEEHPYADENFLSSKPTRDAGGQFIGVFTVNKQKPDSLPKSVFRGAWNSGETKEGEEGQNGFTYLFDPFSVRPGRDEIWYENTKKNIPNRDLAKLTPDLYMEQNYPRTIEEALRATSSISAFDYKSLDSMAELTRVPMTTEDITCDLDLNICNIFKSYILGQTYIAASDTAHGIGQDFSCTVIMNARTGEVVADILRNDLPPDEFAYHSVKLLEFYHSPLWYPENNEWGRAVIDKARNMNYKKFGYADKARTKLGWHTNDQTRVDLWGALIPAVNNNQIVIYNRKGLLQFYDVIHNVNNSKVEAPKGRHDDYPTAVGICMAKIKEVLTLSWEPITLEALHFRGAR